MIARYYAQHTELPGLYATTWKSGWQVFDRTMTEPKSSDPVSVGFFRSKLWAYRVRDALNAREVPDEQP